MNKRTGTSQKPVDTREWYDFIGLLADVLPGMHLGGQDATRELLDMCRLDATSRVLDVGCGPGTTACFAAEQYGSRVLGIDISEIMVAKAKERARRQGLAGVVEFRAADVFQLPFDDDSFDVALFESVLIPLPGDKRQALAEVMRVVRPGGLVGANETTVDPATPAEMMALFDRHPAIYGHFTPQTLRSLFEAAGLQLVQTITGQQAGVPSPLKEMGLRGLLSFMVRVYPKILLKLLRDARFREASQIDNAITKRGKQYMGYTLIVGQKPG
jgi:arsenite methyltransferase